MTISAPEQLRQRADYTHKFNLRTGRHGWLRLTPAYSVKIVEELIDKCSGPLRILDPFSGTATTALSAAYHGHDALSTDINPFLVWFGRVKVAHYSRTVILRTRQACAAILDLVKCKGVHPVLQPPIHKIERWWAPKELHFLRLLRAAIDAATDHGTPERNLLLVAFCRTLIALSNVAFNHQSMSFKQDSGQQMLDIVSDLEVSFADNVGFVLLGAEQNPLGNCEIIEADARSLLNATKNRFNLVITSPPYANRMSYIRELRPYMYWLGYLLNGRDAGELDWSAIGGTWGIATSRLSDWQPHGSEYYSPELVNLLTHIAHEDNANGQLLANYIAKYFADIWEHFKSLRQTLDPEAKIHYIVGNSSFYGVLLPVQRIYADMLTQLSFTNVNIRPVRKRNSNKELLEFDVSASWQD